MEEVDEKHPFQVFLEDCLKLMHCDPTWWVRLGKDKNWALLWAWGCQPHDAVIIYLHDILPNYDMIYE